MVVNKPTRDFTSLNRVSYTASNGSKSALEARQTATGKKTTKDACCPQPGKAASTNLEYKENQCAALGSGIGARHHQECPFAVMADQYASTVQKPWTLRFQLPTSRFMAISVTESQQRGARVSIAQWRHLSS